MQHLTRSPITVLLLGLWIGLNWFATSVSAQDSGGVVALSSDAMWGYSSPLNYKILPRPKTHHHKSSAQHVYSPPQSTIESRPVEPYAYGWFGTKPSPHWHRQFGYQKDYTQWTLR